MDPIISRVMTDLHLAEMLVSYAPDSDCWLVTVSGWDIDRLTKIERRVSRTRAACTLDLAVKSMAESLNISPL